jgi:SAM-dependent methyltransferase
MVITARKNAPNGEFLVQDLRDTDFPARVFDVIVMSFCIVHLIDIEAATLISRMESWLKPGGLLYLSFMEGKQPGLESTSFSDSPIFFNYYDGNVIMTLLQQHGLSITRISRTGYAETDGSITTDVFIFAAKPVMS